MYSRCRGDVCFSSPLYCSCKVYSTWRLEVSEIELQPTSIEVIVEYDFRLGIDNNSSIFIYKIYDNMFFFEVFPNTCTVTYPDPSSVE